MRDRRSDAHRVAGGLARPSASRACPPGVAAVILNSVVPASASEPPAFRGHLGRATARSGRSVVGRGRGQEDPTRGARVPSRGLTLRRKRTAARQGECARLRGRRRDGLGKGSRLDGPELWRRPRRSVHGDQWQAGPRRIVKRWEDRTCRHGVEPRVVVVERLVRLPNHQTPTQLPDTFRKTAPRARGAGFLPETCRGAADVQAVHDRRGNSRGRQKPVPSPSPVMHRNPRQCWFTVRAAPCFPAATAPSYRDRLTATGKLGIIGQVPATDPFAHGIFLAADCPAG